jgi:hypothetical protein
LDITPREGNEDVEIQTEEPPVALQFAPPEEVHEVHAEEKSGRSSTAASSDARSSDDGDSASNVDEQLQTIQGRWQEQLTRAVEEISHLRTMVAAGKVDMHEIPSTAEFVESEDVLARYQREAQDREAEEVKQRIQASQVRDATVSALIFGAIQEQQILDAIGVFSGEAEEEAPPQATALGSRGSSKRSSTARKLEAQKQNLEELRASLASIVREFCGIRQLPQPSKSGSPSLRQLLDAAKTQALEAIQQTGAQGGPESSDLDQEITRTLALRKKDLEAAIADLENATQVSETSKEEPSRESGKSSFSLAARTPGGIAVASDLEKIEDPRVPTVERAAEHVVDAFRAAGKAVERLTALSERQRTAGSQAGRKSLQNTRALRQLAAEQEQMQEALETLQNDDEAAKKIWTREVSRRERRQQTMVAVRQPSLGEPRPSILRAQRERAALEWIQGMEDPTRDLSELRFHPERFEAATSRERPAQRGAGRLGQGLEPERVLEVPGALTSGFRPGARSRGQFGDQWAPGFSTGFHPRNGLPEEFGDQWARGFSTTPGDPTGLDSRRSRK